MTDNEQCNADPLAFLKGQGGSAPAARQLTAAGCITSASLILLLLAGMVAKADTAPQIDAKNWYWGPGNRWSYKHTSRIFPSATIYRGNGPIAKLDYALRDLDDISFMDPTTKMRMSVAHMYTATDTDAFLVMKDGKIVTERYFNGMKPEDTHLLMSVSKSVLGVLSGIIVGEGRLDPNALVTSYIPELKGSAYEGATVRHLLDMSVGMEFDEDYASKTSDLYRLDEAAGWVERGPNAVAGLHVYLSTLKARHGAHGSEFRYISPNADVMGWVLERATNTDFADLVSKELWSKLGAERDDEHFARWIPGCLYGSRFEHDAARSRAFLANGSPAVVFTTDSKSCPEIGSRISATAEIPQAWRKGPAYSYYRTLSGYENGSYRSYWYVADPRRGHLAAIGLAGQLIVIDPSSNTIVVKFSSHATPAIGSI